MLFLPIHVPRTAPLSMHSRSRRKLRSMFDRTKKMGDIRRAERYKSYIYHTILYYTIQYMLYNTIYYTIQYMLYNTTGCMLYNTIYYTIRYMLQGCTECFCYTRVVIGWWFYTTPMTFPMSLTLTFILTSTLVYSIYTYIYNYKQSTFQEPW